GWIYVSRRRERAPVARREFPRNPARPDRPPASAGTVSPSTEAGGDRPFGRRRGARFQQLVDGHRWLLAHGIGGIARRPFAPRVPCRNRTRRRTRGSAYEAIAGIQPEPANRVENHYARRSDPRL